MERHLNFLKHTYLSAMKFHSNMKHNETRDCNCAAHCLPRSLGSHKYTCVNKSSKISYICLYVSSHPNSDLSVHLKRIPPLHHQPTMTSHDSPIPSADFVPPPPLNGHSTPYLPHLPLPNPSPLQFHLPDTPSFHPSQTPPFPVSSIIYNYTSQPHPLHPITEQRAYLRSSP